MRKENKARQYIYIFSFKDIPQISPELLYSYETRNKPRIFEGDDEKTRQTVLLKGSVNTISP